MPGDCHSLPISSKQTGRQIGLESVQRRSGAVCEEALKSALASGSDDENGTSFREVAEEEGDIGGGGGGILNSALLEFSWPPKLP